MLIPKEIKMVDAQVSLVVIINSLAFIYLIQSKLLFSLQSHCREQEICFV